MRYFAAALCLLITATATNLSAVPAQVIIIPNGEIDPLGNLTQTGLERAGALAAYIMLTPTLDQFGEPIAIFAARPISSNPPNLPSDNTQACILTCAPIAQALKLPIHSGYSKLQSVELASFILNNPDYNGLNVLVCWRPDSIQALVAALGAVSPPPYPANVYNITWVVTFSQSIALGIYPQDLLMGD